MIKNILIFLSLLCVNTAFGTTWNVGPSRTYTYCSQVAPLVDHGDTIQIDFATYVNDPQVIWNKNNLFITGIGGRPRLQAGSIIANDMVNGKGIFVISGANVHVYNIEFANAVVQDNNGAGIRQEGANLWVSNCRFTANEMGILCGNIPNCKTTVEYCAFVNNGSTMNPGYQHNIYINHIDTLVFRYNYSRDAIAEGHELKSRATYNFILYNRISNEQSVDSRTIDLPNGGISVVVGNIIEQGPNSANSNLLGYGLEGLTNPAQHMLYCCSNSFINKKATGSFIQVANGMDTLFVKNNAFAGAKTGGLILGSPAILDSSNNAVNNSVDAFGFLDESSGDYHLLPGSMLVDAGVNLTRHIFGYPIQPVYSYVDTCYYEPRIITGLPDIGAYEYSSPLATVDPVLTDVRIFPNPASRNLQIFIGGNSPAFLKTSFINTCGNVVLHKQLLYGYNDVDVSGLIPGVYFVRVAGEDITLIRKVILQ